MIFRAFLISQPVIYWVFPLNLIGILCFLAGLGLEWLSCRLRWWIVPLLLLVFIGMMEIVVRIIYDESAQGYLFYGMFATMALLGSGLYLLSHWIWKRVHS